MTRALASAGLAVHVATTDDDGAGHLDVPLGKPVPRDRVTYWFFRRQTQFYKFSLPLTRWLARHAADYDIIHIHALFSYTSLPTAFYAHRADVPYIVRPLGVLNRYGMEQHHPGFKRISFPFVERRILEHAAVIHYTSEQEQEEAEALGIKSRGVIIPLGIEPLPESSVVPSDRLEENAANLVGRTIFLFLARLDPKKGLDLLIPAFAQAKKDCPDIGLIIAGDGERSYVENLHSCAVQLGLEQDIVWAGYVEGANKTALFHSADAFVLPSHSENFGIAVVEALAAGLPVIMSDQIGIHPEIAAQDAGIVVPLDVDAISRALVRLCNDQEARRRMGENANALASSHYSIHSMTTRLLETYNQLVPSYNEEISCVLPSTMSNIG